jgi:NADPH-ferrihemoprotein reductase
LNYLPLQKRNVIVFYGSQTGTAEEFAGRLAKDAMMYGSRDCCLRNQGLFDKELTPKLTGLKKTV